MICDHDQIMIYDHYDHQVSSGGWLGQSWVRAWHGLAATSQDSGAWPRAGDSEGGQGLFRPGCGVVHSGFAKKGMPAPNGEAEFFGHRK